MTYEIFQDYMKTERQKLNIKIQAFPISFFAYSPSLFKNSIGYKNPCAMENCDAPSQMRPLGVLQNARCNKTRSSDLTQRSQKGNIYNTTVQEELPNW